MAGLAQFEASGPRLAAKAGAPDSNPNPLAGLLGADLQETEPFEEDQNREKQNGGQPFCPCPTPVVVVAPGQLFPILMLPFAGVVEAPGSDDLTTSGHSRVTMGTATLLSAVSPSPVERQPLQGIGFQQKSPPTPAIDIPASDGAAGSATGQGADWSFQQARSDGFDSSLKQSGYQLDSGFTPSTERSGSQAMAEVMTGVLKRQMETMEPASAPVVENATGSSATLRFRVEHSATAGAAVTTTWPVPQSGEVYRPAQTIEEPVAGPPDRAAILKETPSATHFGDLPPAENPAGPEQQSAQSDGRREQRESDGRKANGAASLQEPGQVSGTGAGAHPQFVGDGRGTSLAIPSDARPMSRPATLAPAPSHNAEHRPPLRAVQVQVGEVEGRSVQLRFVESAGTVRVSVRTEDQGLAAALTMGSEGLQARLQSQGWRSEFHPVVSTSADLREGAGLSSSEPGQTLVRETTGGTPLVRGPQTGMGAGADDPNRRQNTTWAEQNEELMNTAALRRLSQRGVGR